MTVDRLRDELPGVTVLDVRWQLGRADGHADHLAGHVPGAAFVDLEHDLADPPGVRGRHPLPDPERFEAAMRRCGVRQDRPVVVYDDWSGPGRDPRLVAAAAPRAPRRTGARRRVALLGGGRRRRGDRRAAVPAGRLPRRGRPAAGRRRRRAAGWPATACSSTPGPPSASGARWSRSTRSPATSRARSTCRPPRTCGRDGSCRVDELATTYAAVEGAREVAAYCGSGVTATHDVFALHLLGREAALYPGSWSEWVALPGRAVSVSET